jgi:undecaprenyl-diphosphatase
MDLLQALILGIVQGTTEFLPISSSAHLVLVPWALGWPKPGLPFDTMVHWGTLVAVVTYFHNDLWQLTRAWWASVRERSTNPDPYRRVAWLLLIGTLPGALAGFLFEDFFTALFSQPRSVAALLLLTGALLALSEGIGQRTRQITDVRLADALIIGLGQALAIAPGVSRSGATIAAGLGRGLTREAAARFSFLLATPIILGAGLLQALRLATSAHPGTNAALLLAGFASSAAVGYLCIRFLLDYLRRRSLWVFAAYCWLVGLLALGYSLLR